jgi:hypothetical protein
MSQDPVVAVGWISTDPMERYSASIKQVDLSQFDPSAKGAHLSTTTAAESAPTVSGMNVRNLYTAFQDGMRNGFVQPDMERMLAKLHDIQQPGSKVSVGELQAELVISSGKVALAESIAKISSKVAEGLQTLVVKQG